MQEGKIIKVSGPLVVADGMRDAKMFDVVRVSNERLVGEVIELRGDRASIQVYEETAGLGPGDPVFSTGESLSVELGPGLIESIYDGIQRPLDAIRAVAGDRITRGIEMPGLNRKKKWHFTPTVQKGAKVASGDIIGEVQETALVLHKIVVPVDVEGEIEEIKEGDYTVEEVIASIKTGSGIREITMMQRWPVREPRPYKSKQPPTIPLITGQRIIDAFFPIGKGGTACVPGPFGSGKCVSGDTIVILANGEIYPIQELFEKYKNKGQRVINNNEEYTVLNRPIKILSYVDGKIITNSATSIYKGQTQQLIEITTRAGKKIKITPIHKLLVVDENLSITEKPAFQLKIGDCLVAPRHLPVEGQKIKIKIADYLPQARIADGDVINEIPALLEKLAKKHGNLKEVAKKLQIPYPCLINYKLKRTHPPVSFVERVGQSTGIQLTYHQVKGERDSKIVSIPRYLNQDLAEFLGFLYGDGMIKGNAVRFYNNDSEIQARFAQLSEKLFGLKPKQTITNTVLTNIINSSVVASFIEALGFPEYQKSRTCVIPAGILQSTDQTISKFLGAYFLTDGHFGQNQIEISTASAQMSVGLTYLLTRLGILSKVRCGKIPPGPPFSKEGRESSRYRIFISNKNEIAKFYRHCQIGSYTKFKKMETYLLGKQRAYTTKDIVPISANLLETLYIQAGRPYQKLKTAGVEIHNYIGKNAERLSKTTFTLVAQTLKTPLLQKIAYNHLEHIFYDEITEVKLIEQETDVYDIEVPLGHNFVGGNSPIFLHNTVIQHQLAKWADANIIVYIGCGERGNEMTDVLLEFPKLIDPKSGEPLMRRTVLIANTSNMPVAAREASIYTGVTIAEYFRDMGYSVAIMADSTSRWAEAMREISGRLEEMPGEEGYPAYLGTRIAEFYQRSGRVICLGNDSREGALSIMGAVSPPGGDLSDPVVQATLRVVGAFWSLEDKLAYRRHFPAINWLTSYSLYLNNLEEYFRTEIGEEWLQMRQEAMRILEMEAELEEIVRLVGLDALSPENRLIMETARAIREDFLYQNAFHEVDSHTSFDKQYKMLDLILFFHQRAEERLKSGVNIDDIARLNVREEIARARYIAEENLSQFETIKQHIEAQMEELKSRV